MTADVDKALAAYREALAQLRRETPQPPDPKPEK